QIAIDVGAIDDEAVWPVLDRVLVETLTNVRRHAGPDAPVTVQVTASEDAPRTLQMSVRNGPGTGGIGTGSGTGLQPARTGEPPRRDDRGRTRTGRLDRADLPAADDEGRRPMITVAVVDDQEMVRMGFSLILDAEEAISVIGQAADGAEAIDLARRE